MSNVRKPVLIGVNDAGSNEPTIVAGVLEAARRGLPVELTHSTHYLYLPSHDNEAPLPAMGPTDEMPRESLIEAERIARRIDPNIELVISVQDGDPVENLIKRSHDVAMIVLGTHRTPTLWGAVLRSIGQSVAAHAHCPVLLVNHAEHPDKPAADDVLVGVSTTRGGRAALRFAFEEARARQVKLVAVRCAPMMVWAAATPMGNGTYLYQDWEKAELAVIDHALAAFADEFADVPVERKALNEGTPVALETLSAYAGLLVVGARRRDDHWRSRLGPVAGWLLHHSYCPIAIVGQPASVPDNPTSTADAQAVSS